MQCIEAESEGVLETKTQVPTAAAVSNTSHEPEHVVANSSPSLNVDAARPPDFRSILQNDEAPTNGASASPAGASNAPVGNGLGGVEVASSKPYAPGQVQAASAGIGSVAGDPLNAGAVGAGGPLGSATPLNPLSPATGDTNGPGVVGNLGGGGVGGGRRMRPPDFRSILQNDEAPTNVASASAAVASNAPVGNGLGGGEVASSNPHAPGQVQAANAGIGSVAGDPLNAGAVGAGGPLGSATPLNPLSPATGDANGPGVVGNLGGGGVGGGRRMRPPDFRSILQNDEAPTNVASASPAVASNAPVGNGLGGVEVASSNPYAPGQVQAANAGIGSVAGDPLNAGAVGAGGPLGSATPLNPLSPATVDANGPGVVGNLGGGGVGGGRRMRPPDFRSILQNDEAPTNVASASPAVASNAPVGNGLSGVEVASSKPYAPGQVQAANAGIGSVAGDPLNAGAVGAGGPLGSATPLNPLSPATVDANGPGVIGNLGGGGVGGGRRMRPPDFRSILQSDESSPDGASVYGLGGAANFSSNQSGAVGTSILQTDFTSGIKLSEDAATASKPAVSPDPFGLDDLSGGYVPA